jgi:hypothetical protein
MRRKIVKLRKSEKEVMKTTRLSEQRVMEVERHRRRMKAAGLMNGNPTWSDALRDMIRRASQIPRRRRGA